jgi:hypothetical protein
MTQSGKPSIFWDEIVPFGVKEIDLKPLMLIIQGLKRLIYIPWC